MIDCANASAGESEAQSPNYYHPSNVIYFPNQFPV